MNKVKSGIIGLAIATMVSTPAMAMNINTSSSIEHQSYIEISTLSLKDAKSQGLVGEKPDGLLGAVKISADATALVSSINVKRMQKYQSLAKKHGVSVLAIQKQAAKKIITSTPAGQFYMSADGSWVKK